MTPVGKSLLEAMQVGLEEALHVLSGKESLPNAMLDVHDRLSDNHPAEGNATADGHK